MYWDCFLGFLAGQHARSQWDSEVFPKDLGSSHVSSLNVRGSFIADIVKEVISTLKMRITLNKNSSVSPNISPALVYPKISCWKWGMFSSSLTRYQLLGGTVYVTTVSNLHLAWSCITVYSRTTMATFVPGSWPQFSDVMAVILPSRRCLPWWLWWMSITMEKLICLNSSWWCTTTLASQTLWTK